MRAISDFIWRVRCAYWFSRRLGWASPTYMWELSSIQLGVEQENRERHGDPLPPPQESVDEELSCWGD